MLTQLKILKGTPKKTLQNSLKVRLKSFDFKPYTDPKDLTVGVRIFSKCVRPEPEGSGVTRNVEIRVFRDNGPKGLLWASCSCEMFCWWGCEVSLAMHGSSSVIYSDGSVPLTRDPQFVPFICHHCVSVLRKVNSTQKIKSMFKNLGIYTPPRPKMPAVIAPVITNKNKGAKGFISKVKIMLKNIGILFPGEKVVPIPQTYRTPLKSGPAKIPVDRKTKQPPGSPFQKKHF